MPYVLTVQVINDHEWASGEDQFPGSDAQPYYTFDTLTQLVEVIKAMGQGAGLDVDEYAALVLKEGKDAERTTRHWPVT